MAAHEQHDEGVVLIGDVGRGRLLSNRSRLALSPRPFAAVVVDQPPRGGLGQPGPRVLRHAVPGPPQGGRDERFLDGVLARVEIAVPPNERAEDLRREPAQQVLDTGAIAQRAPPACWRYSSISATLLGD